MTKPKIGFIGQGYVGKNYADDFERRGYAVVRYTLEEPYKANKDEVGTCDIVFIAVPTPTTPFGFDASIVEAALALVGIGKTAVIKSTILPGTTDRLQAAYPDKTVLFSPEFLSEKTAAKDATNPAMNIVGIPNEDARSKAEAVLPILPKAPFQDIMSAREAELVKYAHNVNGYFQIILSNFLYDAASAVGADWAAIQKGIQADPYISNRYASPVHKSGRGAGGHCFIKDFAAFRELYLRLLPQDAHGAAVLSALEQKNISLLLESKKDLDLLRGVYGNEITDTHANSR